MTHVPPRRARGAVAGRAGWAATVALACAAATIAKAGGLAIDPAALAGGGARSVSPGGCLAVTAIIGQEPLTPASGGGFTLAPGLWPALAGLPGDALFIDGFQECL